MISNEKRIAVANKSIKPPKKKKSAIFSNRPVFLIFPLIDKKESKQLVIKNMIAKVVNSSIIVFSVMLSSFNEVNTTKQSPNKLDDAFNICGDLFFSSCIFNLKLVKNLNANMVSILLTCQKIIMTSIF